MVTLGVPVPEIVADPAAIEPPVWVGLRHAVPAETGQKTCSGSPPVARPDIFAIFLGIESR